MTPAQFQKLFEQKLNNIKQYAAETLPHHIGKIAREHFEQNFRLGGYVDQNLQPWQPAKRIGSGEGASSNYGTLLSSHPNLSTSIDFTATTRKVIIHTPARIKYARIHNEGGSITQQITPKMRKFAWAKYYESAQTDNSWKGLALTKNTTRTFIIPKRQFMGKSKALLTIIQQRIEKDILNIIKQP